MNPAVVTTSRIRASPAWAPSASPTSCDSDAGVQSSVENAVVRPPHWVQVVLDPVAGRRLDDHPGAVGGQRLVDMTGRADRITHVVQAVEHRHQVIAAAR